MKILLLYTYNQGYLSKFFTELGQRLVEEGHIVNCFSLKSNVSHFEDKGVSFYIAKRGGYLKTYYQIFKCIKTLKPDIVLSNFSYVNPALLFGRLLNVKKNIVWFHSLNEQTGATGVNVFVKKNFLKLSDFVIANSELTKLQLYEIYKIPMGKLVTIPFWTNIQEYKGQISTPKEVINNISGFIKVGCPGRLVKHKNHRVVIEALARLSNIHLYIAGKGEERVLLEKLAQDLGVKDRVIFLSHLSSEEMLGFYKNMDIVVLPSLYEAFGLVFIEALALGRPVLVSDRFGVLNYIDVKKFDLNAFTFDPNSRESLETKLLLYLNGYGPDGMFFKELYLQTFNKDIIYKKIKSVILNS